MAAGSLEIYRVPGTVAFLSSGKLLHAIMPRSQCWCVDGVSKFALRVLPDTYYRIELPGTTEEDLKHIEEFRNVLGKVMHFERTSCPFARSNNDEELPELEDSRNKTFSRSDKAKQWKLDKTYGWKGETGEVVQLRSAGMPRPRRELSDIVQSHNEVPPRLARFRQSGNKMPAESLQDHVTIMRSVTEPSILRHKLPLSSNDEEPTLVPPQETAAFKSDQEVQSDGDDLATNDVSTPGTQTRRSSTSVLQPDEGVRVDYFTPNSTLDAASEGRISVETLSPPDIPIEPSEPTDHFDASATVETISQHDSDVLLEGDSAVSTSEEAVLRQTSLATLRPLQHIPTDMPPSPPDSSAGLSVLDETATSFLHENPSLPQTSPESSRKAEESHRLDPATAPAVLPDELVTQTRTRRRSSQASSAEDPFAAIQARILARRSIGGTTSFYPPVTRESTSTSTASVSSSVSSRSRMPLGQQRNLASALVQKACTVFLGPPAYLVAMMLRIAARYANGKFRGVYSLDSDAEGEHGIPGTFHVRADSHTSEEEDDFGVSMYSPIRKAAAKGIRERKNRQRSEVD